MTAPFEKSVVSPALIGREIELGALTRLVEQTVRGSGRIALIAGEAGIGKSRLVTETIQGGINRGARIFRGNCFETDRTLPYAPLTDLLRDYATTHPYANIPPELAPILLELSSPNLTVTFDPEQDKRRLFQALTQFFRAEANPAAFIVIEDLHWCDENSLEFFLHLARRIAPQPILLLFTYRSDEKHSALEHFLAELDRARLATELRLNRLAPPETDAMLRAIFELQRPVRRDFLNVLYPLTEGNPFFIEEILKSLIVAGDIFFADGTWDRKPIHELQIPRTIQDAVHRRAERLTAPAKEALSIASVIGQRFDFSLLHHLMQTSEPELLQCLKELVSSQLILEESPDRFAFRHALTRQAVYTELLGHERLRLHQKVAESLEGAGAAASELAYHFYCANGWAKAFEYSQRAGEQAQALYSPRAAIEHFTHTLEAAKHMRIPPSANLWYARGGAYEMLGDFEKAHDDFSAALNAARAEQDRDEEWQALIELGKLWASRDYAKAGEYYQTSLTLAREMGESSKIASSLNRIGNWHSNLDRPREAIPSHQEALTIFQKLENSEGIADTSDLLGMTNWIGGDMVQSTIYYRQAIQRFRELNDRQGLISSLATLALQSGTYKTATLRLPIENFSLANADREEALKIAREIESRSGEAYALWCLAAGWGSQGEYTRAFENAQASLSIAEEIQHQQWLTAANGILGMLYLDLLALPQAAIHLERALTLARTIGSLHWNRVTGSWLAMALIAQKELGRAESILDAALPPDAPLDSVGKRQCWLARGELALERGNARGALQIADALISSAYSESHTRLSTEEKIIPRLWKLRGEALALQGSPEAETVLRDAIQVASAQGALPLLWRIHVSLGGVNPKTNSEHFDAAREIIEKLARKFLDEGLRDNFARRAYALVPTAPTMSARQMAKKEFGGLTAREREVAGMIAQGKANREIAVAMVVSERTIETHVGNILGKLGFGSRAQIAVWAVEKKIGSG